MRRDILWACVAGALALVVAVKAYAADTFRFVNPTNGAVLRLLQKPCENPAILAHIPAPVRAAYRFNAGIGMRGVEHVEFCYTVDEDGDVIFVTDGGVVPGYIPLRAFTRETPA